MSLLLPWVIGFSMALGSQTYQGLEVEKATVKFLAKNGMDFSKYKPSVARWEDCPADYLRVEDRFEHLGRLDDLFEKFLKLSPLEAWKGMAQFDLLHDRKTGKTLDRNAEAFPPIGVGQIYFLNLNLGAGVKIAVAFEFTRVDRQKKTITFSYLDTNRSSGIQEITFTQIAPAKVQALHASCYTARSKFRDRVLYPPFHTKMLKNFYKNAFAGIDAASAASAAARP